MPISNWIGHISFDDMPSDAAGDICEASMELRALMPEDGSQPWRCAWLTIGRDGRFQVESYDQDGEFNA